jgi:hypothetical protein
MKVFIILLLVLGNSLAFPLLVSDNEAILVSDVLKYCNENHFMPYQKQVLSGLAATSTQSQILQTCYPQNDTEPYFGVFTLASLNATVSIGVFNYDYPDDLVKYGISFYNSFTSYCDTCNKTELSEGDFGNLLTSVYKEDSESWWKERVNKLKEDNDGEKLEISKKVMEWINKVNKDPKLDENLCLELGDMTASGIFQYANAQTFKASLVLLLFLLFLI